MTANYERQNKTEKDVPTENFKNGVDFSADVGVK